MKIVKVKDDSTEGLRFYRPESYLIVTSSATTIQWLPNFTQEYALQVSSGWFGTIEPKITIENGWNLTSYGGTITSNGATAATSIASLLTAAAPFINGKEVKSAGIMSINEPEQRGKLQPGIYRFVFDEKGRVTNLKQVLPE
jgi:hypothetical protein